MRTPPQTQTTAPALAPVVGQPGIPTPPAVPQALDGLAGQLAALQAQLAGLQAQQRDLRSQLRRGPGVDRANTAVQLADINAQIAGVNAQIAAVRADIAARVGIPTAPNIPNFRRGIDGDDVTAIFIVFMLAVLMPISLGITRRLWRRVPKGYEPRVDDVIVPRLERIEQSVDAVAIEIERIAESQRFVTRILAERPRAAASNNASAPAGSQVPAEKPVLALGAGPMENVRVPEREAARQVVTPH
ncbi:MAG TPA: hypothetical protein VL549_11300 [Gemmatimonadales bacterium]|jgi:hypothetical protein|nr:hypothetical protein [Gemmatimonadales bacterium]